MSAVPNQPRQTPSTAPAPQRLGRYRLCFEIASGGMATVYLARVEGPRGFDKLVALKRIHPHLASEREFVAMFLDEARITARINHANVCHVFDFGEAQGSYYIAMEYLVGEPLSRLLNALSHRRSAQMRASDMLPARIARIVADACEGLHAAHELADSNGVPLSVVHRDVSPHNLFVTYDGVVKVVDFGIARSRGRMSSTTTGQVKGKYAYMAPEQVRAEPVDRRADVWSLGVVLWEALTGARLFRRETEAATLTAVLTSRIPRPSEVRHEIARDLDAIVMRALEREPAKRYPTARALGQDLVRFAVWRGVPIGLADIATWLGEIFPGERERKLQLVELAGRVDEPVPKLHSNQHDTSSISDVSRPTWAETASRAGRPTRWLAPVLVLVIGAGVGLVAGMLEGRSVTSPGGALASNAPARAERAAEIDPSVDRVTAIPGEPSADPAASPVAPGATASEPEPRSATSDETAVGATAGTADTVHTAGTRASTARNRSRATSAARHHRAASPSPSVPSSAPAVAPTATTGVVQIATPGGWAFVYEGARRVGQTPMQLTLSTGTHVLEIRPFGRTPGRRVTVRVSGEHVSRVRVPVDG